MPQLIKKISSELFTQIIGNINYLSISGQIQQNNCGSFYGFYGFIQDFTEAKSIITLLKPINFGLKNNTSAVTLEITY